MTRQISAELCAAFLLLLPALASAATRHESELALSVPKEEVSVADLDIEAAAGRHAAMVRLRRAAARVCAPQPEAITEMRCRNQSLSRAKAALARHVAAGDTQLDYGSPGGGHSRP